MSDNPKDRVGSKKVPLAYLPPAGIIYGGLAMANGADKYGPYNFRDSKISYMTYLHAILRHTLALIDGEDTAEDSQLPHLAHIIANGAILADAIEGGFIIDDRPPKGPASKILKKYDKSINIPNHEVKKNDSLDILLGYFRDRVNTKPEIDMTGLYKTTDIDSSLPYSRVHGSKYEPQVPEMTEDTVL